MDDNIDNSLAELQAVVDYGVRYKGGNDFAFREVELRLVRSIRYLAAELQSLRTDN